MKNLFTSESVSEGHPDKLCDQISDAILDYALAHDSEAHVACETFATTNHVFVCGEIRSTAMDDIIKSAEIIARTVARDIGYDSEAKGLDYQTFEFTNLLHGQSPDIAQGVDGAMNENNEQGAGDQGIMFGYACDETEDLMPLPIYLSHRILELASQERRAGHFPWLRPDAKSQVTIDYSGEKPRVDTVVISHQHDPDVDYETIKTTLIQIAKTVLLKNGMNCEDVTYLINPTGKFVIGGPDGDTGLTGRKIIVDTYGGKGRHGGGAFSGKDPSKVDRSAAYMARYIAKNCIAAGLASECEIQLAYAIGYPKPVSVNFNSFGTNKTMYKDDYIAEKIAEVFDCSPAAIIKKLDLKKPIYQRTATYGHFGKKDFTWEQTDMVDALKAAVNLK